MFQPDLRAFALRAPLLLVLSVGLAACGDRPRQETVLAGPELQPLPGTASEALVRMGNSIRESGDLAGASDFYLAAIARDPRNVTPLLGLGDVQLATGATERAEQSFRSALALRPGSQEARLGLAIALLSGGNAREALGYIEPIARRTRDTRVLRNYGVTLDMLGRPDEAQAAYRRGLAQAPADPDLHGNLALSLAVSGDMVGAEREIRAAVNLPNAPDRERVNEVMLLAMAGRDSEAREAGQHLDQPDRAEALIDQGRRAAAATGPLARATALGTITAQPALPGTP